MSDILKEAWERGLPKCPWCGWVMNEPSDLFMRDGQSIDYECEKCEKEFEIRCTIEISYNSEKIVDWVECPICHGTGRVPIGKRDLEILGLEEGTFKCNDCRDGKKYVTEHP